MFLSFYQSLFLDIHCRNALALHDRLFRWPTPLAEASQTVRPVLPMRTSVTQSGRRTQSYTIAKEKRMILGNPYKFAVLIDPVEGWNTDDTFCNGILFLCVNGNIYPKEIETATLRYEVELLKHNLSKLATNQRLYDLPPQQAFMEIYNITFPENVDVDNDYRFDISPTSLADNNYFVFAVCDSTNVRILASKLDYELENSRHRLQDISVNEAIITATELKEIISSLDNIAFNKTAAQ